MNRRFGTLIPFLVATAWVAGTSCETSGVGRTDTTTESMAGLEKFLTGAKKTIGETLASLDQVSKTAAADPRPAFKSYSGGVDKIESAAEGARSRSAAMKTRAKEHQQKWLVELTGIEDEGMRKTAEERRQKAIASFKGLEPVMTEVKTAYEPFIAQLKDIRAYLTNDLSAPGIASVESQARQASERGKEVESKIDKLVAEIARVRKEVEIAKPAPPAAQPAAAPK